MAPDARVQNSIRELEESLAGAASSHPPITLSPAWWQERLLEWATTDPSFRVKLLRFVDVLPTLRTARSIADHVRQYFRESGPAVVQAASGFTSQPIFRPVLSRVVRRGVFNMADRFIAGATPDEAVSRLRDLAADGVASTVDLLGEETLSDAEADIYLARYKELIEALARKRDSITAAGHQWIGVPAVNISIKLSALCPHLEVAAPEYVSEVSRARLRQLLRTAMESEAFVNFDVEQYRYKGLVHRTFADVLMEPDFVAYPHFGIVVQAYLRGAEDDIKRLEALAERRQAPFSVRLVKGAYWDEETILAEQNRWPVPVYLNKNETDESFDRCTDALLRVWPRLRPVFGSHNPHSVAQAIVKSREAALTANDTEFQMLYGMAEGLREAVAADGHRTRVYVPVGEVIPGMAYLVRRLLENTSNQAWFNASVTLDSLRMPATSPAQSRARRDGDGFANASPARFFEQDVRERMHSAIAEARSGFGSSHPLLIGDDAVADREHGVLTYPAEPQLVLGHVAQATAADIDRAVETARRAYPAWNDTPARERGDILRRAASIMADQRYELAAIMVFESAKPWHEADGDVTEAIDFLRYYATQAEDLERPRRMGDVPGEENVYSHHGRGVVAVIAPWNFPLAIITGMSTAAIAGGNAAILKPAGQSPIIAARLVNILREAGVPSGIVQYLPGPGGEVGRALVDHSGVDTIAFTGSNAVGLQIIEAAAQTKTGQRNVKRVIAEMGGKNAIIVDEDADLDQAIGETLLSTFGYAGQKCSACSRLIIVSSAYEEATERLRNGVASLFVGPPHDPATFVPPVISASAKETIDGCIATAEHYSTLLVQGNVPAHSRGHYVRPTVFTGVPEASPLATEEIFGPVLAVFRAETFEEALGVATRSPFSLTGGVFSRNPRHIEMARRRFNVGNLYINRKTTGAIVSRQPFGGTAMSGIGEKAGGPDYVRQFMEPRTIAENTVRRGFSPDETSQSSLSGEH